MLPRPGAPAEVSWTLDVMAPGGQLADGDGVTGVVALSPGLVVAVAGVVVVLLVLVALLGWWGVRRVRRSGLLDRGVLQARAAVLPPGPAKDIAELRQLLRDSLAQTRKVLGTVSDGPGAPESLTDLLRRLEVTTGSLDAQVRLVQSEPDQIYLLQVLPSLRERVHSADSDAVRLRRTALRFQSEGNRLQRTLLEDDLRDSVAGLEAGLTEIQQLPQPRSATPAAPGAPPRPREPLNKTHGQPPVGELIGQLARVSSPARGHRAASSAEGRLIPGCRGPRRRREPRRAAR